MDIEVVKEFAKIEHEILYCGDDSFSAISKKIHDSVNTKVYPDQRYNVRYLAAIAAAEACNYHELVGIDWFTSLANLAGITGNPYALGPVLEECRRELR